MVRTPARTRARSIRRPTDMTSLAEGMSRPGIDPRQWISVAHVDSDDPYSFDPDLGPLIACTLQPAGTPVHCRVSMQVAGDGEADYHPFVEGDGVLVALLGGSERDAVIIGRLSSKRAPFPASSVGGQDPTKNSLGFTRRKTPYIMENAGPLMLREAMSEAFLSLDEKGVITLRDGQKAALQMTPDTFGYQSGDAKALLQLDLTGGRFTLKVDDALLTLSSSKASPEVSAIAVPGQLAISTGTQPAAEHAISAEAVCNLLAVWTQAIGAAITAALPLAIVTPAAGAPLGPLIGTPLSAVFGGPPLGAGLTLLAGAVAAAAEAPLDGAIAAALYSAFQAAGQKPPGLPNQGQVKPGVGCAGLLVG